MKLLMCVRAEASKELIESRRYLFTLLTSIAVQAMIFMGIIFLAVGLSPLDGPRMDRSTDEFLLIGYLMWTFAMFALNNMGQDIMNESMTGTLEQKCMAAAPIHVMLAGRAIGNLIVSGVYVGGLLLVITRIAGIRLQVPIDVLPVVVLTLLGVYGLGYVIAGAAIVYKRVGQLGYAVQMLLLFFGAFVVPGNIHSAVYRVSEWLPLTLGVQAVRLQVMHGHSLADVVASGLVLRIGVLAAMWLACGLCLFSVCLLKARRMGTLGRY